MNQATASTGNRSSYDVRGSEEIQRATLGHYKALACAQNNRSWGQTRPGWAAAPKETEESLRNLLGCRTHKCTQKLGLRVRLTRYLVYRLASAGSRLSSTLYQLASTREGLKLPCPNQVKFFGGLSNYTTHCT